MKIKAWRPRGFTENYVVETALTKTKKKKKKKRKLL